MEQDAAHVYMVGETFDVIKGVIAYGVSPAYYLLKQFGKFHHVFADAKKSCLHTIMVKNVQNFDRVIRNRPIIKRQIDCLFR